MVPYDPHEWWSHFFSIRGSMIKNLVGRIALVGVWAALVVLLNERLDHLFEVPLTVHSIVGSALGLLLVFRTNAANERYWEGRKLWGGMVNESRNLARITAVLLESAPDLTQRIRSCGAAFAHAAMHKLRGQGGVGEGKRWLSPQDLAGVEASADAPLWCAQQISMLLKQGRDRALLSTYDFVYADTNVQQLVGYIGGCERIHKTPLPFAYLVHLRRALVLYCIALPFALSREFGWLTVPTTLFVSYVFFGIEEIGVEIEDPFGTDDNDLPLEDICQTIERGFGFTNPPA